MQVLLNYIRKNWGWCCIVLSGAAFGLFCFMLYKEELKYERYEEAVYSELNTYVDDKTQVMENIKSIDFSSQEFCLDITQEEEVFFKRAYLKVLKNGMPIIDENEKITYYKDLWKAGIEWETLWASRAKKEFPYEVYYNDLDGDGQPELAINQGCFYILKYDLAKDECRILYSMESRYFGGILSAGGIWYHDGQHANIIRDRYIVFDGESEWNTVLELEHGFDEDNPYYMVGTKGLESQFVDEDRWNEVTKSFYEATQDKLLPQGYENIFGKVYEEQMGVEENITESVEWYLPIMNVDCTKYEQITRGDFNVVQGLTTDEIDELKHVFSVNKEVSQWLNLDINEDGKHELVWCVERGENFPVLAIFVQGEDGAGRVLWDIMDSGEYHFVVNNKIVFYWRYSGIHEHYCFYLAKFDEECKVSYQDRYEVIRITDAEESKHAWPDYEEGTYYIKTTGISENIQKQEMAYEEWLADMEGVIGLFNVENMLQ